MKVKYAKTIECTVELYVPSTSSFTTIYTYLRSCNFGQAQIRNVFEFDPTAYRLPCG